MRVGPRDDETRIGPVKVIIGIGVVRGADDNDEPVDAADVDINLLRSLVGFQDAAVKHKPAFVGVDLDGSASPADGFIVDADDGLEPLGVAVEHDVESAGRMRADAALEGGPVQAQRHADNGMICHGFSPTLADLAKVELVQPDGARPRHAGHRKKEDKPGHARLEGFHDRSFLG